MAVVKPVGYLRLVFVFICFLLLSFDDIFYGWLCYCDPFCVIVDKKKTGCYVNGPWCNSTVGSFRRALSMHFFMLQKVKVKYILVQALRLYRPYDP